MAADMRIPKKLSGTLAAEGKVVRWNNTRKRAEWGDQDIELPAELPEIAATPTAQGIVDALVELGLVTQAEA